MDDDKNVEEIIALQRMVGQTGMYFHVKQGLREFLQEAGINDNTAPCEIAQALAELADEYEAAWEAIVEANMDDSEWGVDDDEYDPFED